MRPRWTRAPFLFAVLCSLLLLSCFGGHGGGGGGGGNGGNGNGGNGNGGAGANNNPVFAIAVADSGNFQQGSKNVTYTIDVTNTGKVATSGNVEVDVTLPAGESFVSISGGSGGTSGWTFTGGQVITAMRADSLAPGASYPILTITVNVSLNATSPQVLMASVSGGGAATANNQDSTAILTHVSILLGRYAFLFSGFDANGAVAIAGSINVDANGNVTGKEDFKDPSVVQPGQVVAGFCQNLAIAAAGFCKLTASGRTSQYDFVLRNNETVARFAEDPADGVANTGSGVLIAQTITTQNALTSAGGFNGFFSIGFDGTDAAGGRMALEGNIFTNLSGAIAAQGGILPQGDVNDSGTLIQPANSTTANVTGNFTPVGTATVDSFGRATMTMTIGTAPSSQTLTLALYILAPEVPASNQSGRAFAIDITPIATSKQVLSGQFFWLGNPSPLPFSNSSISGTNVFALSGLLPGTPGPPPTAPSSNTVMGTLTAMTAQTGQVLLDVNTAGTINGGAGISKPLTGTYTLGTVAANGRVVLTLTIGMTNYTYVLYLDAPNDGNSLETGGDSTVSFGFFTGQASTNVFSSARTYVIGTLDPVISTVPNSVSPITLTPGASGSGTFSTGSVSGTYAIDLTTGRGTSVATSGNVPQNPHSVFYVIAPNLVVLMGADQGLMNDAISLIQF